MPEMTQPVGKNMVPFYNLSKNPQVWADDFLKAEAAEAEYLKLKSEYDQIRKMPRAKSSQIELLKKAYSDHCQKISKELAGFMTAYGADVFNRLPHTPNSPINSFIPKDIFEAALDQMAMAPDPPDAMTDAERQKKLDAIQKKMNEQKEKIKKYSPQSYFQLKNGSVKCDARREFVEFWRNKQSWVARPCDPQGVDLEHSSDDINWLHKKLAIGAAISPKAHKLPFRP